MSGIITVREYARLTTASEATPSLDLAKVPASAFDWLCRLNAGFRKGGAPLVQIEDRRLLRLDNYVGVVETPCGTRLEILPKYVEEGEDEASARALLTRMIAANLDLSTREVGEASLSLFNAPLSEWVMGQFLAKLDHLVKRGVRSDYQRVEASGPFLRGQLDVVRQMRQPPGRQHVFQIKHDIFTPDRAENRLLRAALDIVCDATQTPDNWRLAHELRCLIGEIPASRGIANDFRLWRKDSLMAHYQPLRPWCELILYRQMPLAAAGEWRGISMLFPMERLFERYVATALRRQLPNGARLTTQATHHSLCSYDGKPLFQLRPDMVVEHAGKRWVLDTKWKLLDKNDREGKYGLQQSDFYQLFAYGQKYLEGDGDMALIYPRHSGFDGLTAPFEFSSKLRLWVLAFDMEEECLTQENTCGLPLHSGKYCMPTSLEAMF